MRDLLGRPTGPAPENPAQAVAVAYLLGLTPLERRHSLCHRFANGCVCADCAERGERRAADLKPRRIRQPWEPELKRAA